MKRLLFGLLIAAAGSLLVPLPASAAVYDTFVGCDDLSPNPVPSHTCQLGDFPGAYFESDVDTEYEVCVEFPGGTFLCAEEQLAEAGVLYVNSITTNVPGDHFVYWFVGEEEVGFWDFRINAPAPPPPPRTPTPPIPVLPSVAPAPSVECLKAQQRVVKLRGQLQKASGKKQKARIRGKLRKARSTVRSAC